MKKTTYNKLEKEQKELLDHATRAMETAYNPYSWFFVWSVIKTKSGDIISGSNVENAAYGSCICAERAAILRANAMGHREFFCIAINAKWIDFDTQEVTAPCGNCRQMIFESSQICEQDIQIILSTTNKETIVITSINELLPLAFWPKNLWVAIQKFQD
jgi:cytidine deaminase